MQAFHNDIKIKEFYLNRVREHYKMDEIIQGIYWENGKGCAVGCTIHSNNHDKYENKLGIPRVLAVLEDKIFENLPNYIAKTWPLRFLEAISVGADLSKVWPNFAIFLLTHPTQCNSRHPQCKIVADCYQSEINGNTQNWQEIKKNTYPGAYAAANCAYSTAVVSAANAGNYISAPATIIATINATYAAVSAANAVSATDAYIAQSEKLLELLNKSKINELNKK